MRKHIILCILIVILLLSSLSLCIGCKQQSSPPSIVPLPSPSSTEELEITSIYTNAEYNFSFHFSEKEFELLESYLGADVALLGPLLWDMKHHINILVKFSPSPKKMSLDDFVKNDIKELKSILANYEIIDQYASVIDGLPSEMVVFSYTSEVGEEIAKYKDISVAFIKDKTIYTVYYNVPEELHDKYLPYFNSLLATFQFNDN